MFFVVSKYTADIIWTCTFRREYFESFSESKTKVEHGVHFFCQIKTTLGLFEEEHTNIICTKFLAPC
jgi:hypothetical protein